MTEHPEVFISATTRDLGGYRREIKDALLSLQIFAIEESTFTSAYGPSVSTYSNVWNTLKRRGDHETPARVHLWRD